MIASRIGSKLGALLVAEEKITQEELEAALKVQASSHVVDTEVATPLGQICVDLGFCVSSDIDDAIVKRAALSREEVLSAAADGLRRSTQKLRAITEEYLNGRV